MTEQRSIEANEDPVCGMGVDTDAAREKGLTTTHDGHEYVFCGKGCLLGFVTPMHGDKARGHGVEIEWD